MFEFYNFVSFKWDNGDRDFLIFFFELFCFGGWSDFIQSLVTWLEGDISGLLRSVDYALLHHYDIINTSLLCKCKANLAYKGLLELGFLPKMSHSTMQLPCSNL
jgi:hypothetical protein